MLGTLITQLQACRAKSPRRADTVVILEETKHCTNTVEAVFDPERAAVVIRNINTGGSG
jgi:hypothetical protein